MAETMRPQSALVGVGRIEQNGADFALSERWPLSVAQIAMIAGVAARIDAVEALLGFGLPPANRAVSSGVRTGLCIGAARWLVVAPRDQSVAAQIEQAAAGTMATTDLSHARTAMRIAGAKARDVLASRCAVDFHPRAFGPGACVVTSLARLAAVIHQIDAAPAFEVLVARSFARELWHSLAESAAEQRVS